jgi:hypothetical protein
MPTVARPLPLAVLLTMTACLAPSTERHDGGEDAGQAGGGGGDGGGGGVAQAPIKLLFAFDGSPSMGVTDPNGSRVAALRAALDALPGDSQVSISVLVFSGSTVSYLTNPPNQFVALSSITASERQLLLERLGNFTSPSPSDSTDFVGPLTAMYTLTSNDVSQAQLSNTTGVRYSLVFLSDGKPSTSQDDQLLCGDVVSRIRDLKAFAGDVRLDTVHVFTPLQPIGTTCTNGSGLTPPAQSCGIPTVTTPGLCPIAQVNEDADRLKRMAELGGGTFQDFRDQQPISFSALLSH